MCRWVRTLRSVVMYRTQGAPGSVTACASSSSSCVQKWCVRAGWILSQATWVQCTRHRHQQVSRVNVCDSMIFLDPCRDISARSPLPATAGRPLRSVAKATAVQPLKKMAEMNMLAGWITVEMARPFGMVIDGSNNSLQDVSAGSAAEAVGLEAGDLIVAIDGRPAETDQSKRPAQVKRSLSLLCLCVWFACDVEQARKEHLVSSSSIR